MPDCLMAPRNIPLEPTMSRQSRPDPASLGEIPCATHHSSQLIASSGAFYQLNTTVFSSGDCFNNDIYANPFKSGPWIRRKRSRRTIFSASVSLYVLTLVWCTPSHASFCCIKTSKQLFPLISSWSRLYDVSSHYLLCYSYDHFKLVLAKHLFFVHHRS